MNSALTFDFAPLVPWPLLLLLASVWGASYLFIKVAVDGGFEPGPLMCSRAAIGAAPDRGLHLDVHPGGDVPLGSERPDRG